MKFLFNRKPPIIPQVALIVLALILVLSGLLSPAVISAADPLPDKVTDPAKQVKDPVVLAELLKQSINKDYVELTQDYSLATPYSQTYTDRISKKKITAFSQLPMVNVDGIRVNVGWETIDYKNFTSKVNQFIAKVSEGKVTITAINDQPDGKTKKNHVLTYQPQVYVGGKEVKPLSWTPILLPIDPINENYQNNNLQWDYPGFTRNLRLIEGKILGYWTFYSNPGADVRIVYNQVGQFNLHFGQFGNGTDEEYMPLIVFDNPDKFFSSYPLTIQDSLTFYPNAHPESTSIDGRAYITGQNSTWATIRAAAGTGSDDSGVEGAITYILSSNINNQWAALLRTPYLFDASGLPDEAVISAATLSIYGSNVSSKRDNLNCAPDANVYASSPASNTALAAGDFNIASWGSTAFSTAITYANWLEGAGGNPETYRNDFALNASGIAAISKTSITKFGIRNANYDVANSVPNYIASQVSWVAGYFAEQGNGYKPTLVVTYAIAPTVTTSAATSITATTATASGNITATGGENADIRGIQWGTATTVYTTNVTSSGNFTAGTFSESLTGLPTGTTIYFRAEAHNSGGWGYGAELTFLTNPAAPTNVAATDGIYTDNVTVMWTASVGATDYHVWRDAVDLGATGNVTSYGDAGAGAPTITPGTTVASDGTSALHVSLSLTGASANHGTVHTYKVVAWNATGASPDSATDTGYRDVGALTYQWQRSAADSDAGYGNIAGATTTTYNDTGAPDDGSGRYYKCVEDATGAVQQTSASNRGYKALYALGPPTNFTLVSVNNTRVDIAWTQGIDNRGVSANNTMVRTKLGMAPTTRTEGNLVFYGMGTSASDNSVSLDETATQTYYSAWSENSTGGWSELYVSSSIGGEGMTLLGTAMGLFTTMFTIILPLGLISGLAFWKPNVPLFMLLAGISMMAGLKWYDTFTDEFGLSISLALIAYAFVCIGFAFRVVFWEPKEESGG